MTHNPDVHKTLPAISAEKPHPNNSVMMNDGGSPPLLLEMEEMNGYKGVDKGG